MPKSNTIVIPAKEVDLKELIRTYLIFKVGERVTRYGTSDEEGSGLGLILSKEFIQKNGGEIWVDSQMGEGSKFSVKLPLEI